MTATSPESKAENVRYDREGEGGRNEDENERQGTEEKEMARTLYIRDPVLYIRGFYI